MIPINAEMNKIVQETYDGLKDIKPETMTKDQYMLMGASLAWLDHGKSATRKSSATSAPVESSIVESTQEDWLINSINEELNFAERYYSEWIDTKNRDFRQMALDSLRHAEVQIRLAISAGVSEEEFKSIRVIQQSLLAKIA